LVLREAPGHAADTAPNACHSERSPALFSSRGICAVRGAVEESLFDVDELRRRSGRSNIVFLNKSIKRISARQVPRQDAFRAEELREHLAEAVPDETGTDDSAALRPYQSDTIFRSPS